MADEPANDTDPEEKPKDEPLAAADVPEKGAPEDSERREFMVKAASMVFGGVVVAIPVGAGLVTLISPLMQEGAGGLKVRLASVGDLPADGTPKRFDVIAERTDAWMKYPRKPIGGVYLRKLPDGKVVAFNTSCPHAGCSVKFRPDLAGYYCPCHKSEFELDGSQGKRCVSARGLDSLVVDDEKLSGGEVWVTFVNYRAGIKEKKAVS